jgi:hypothetical protein
MMDRDDPDEGGMDEKESFSCALAPPFNGTQKKVVRCHSQLNQ